MHRQHKVQKELRSCTVQQTTSYDNVKFLNDPNRNEDMWTILKADKMNKIRMEIRSRHIKRIFSNSINGDHPQENLIK